MRICSLTDLAGYPLTGGFGMSAARSEVRLTCMRPTRVQAWRDDHVAEKHAAVSTARVRPISGDVPTQILLSAHERSP
jgi:hypothetical protein